jgi:hypothetical protein
VEVPFRAGQGGWHGVSGGPSKRLPVQSPVSNLDLPGAGRNGMETFTIEAETGLAHNSARRWSKWPRNGG